MSLKLREKTNELLPPKQTLTNLHLNKGDIMADIGCGTGYFTIPASKIVGRNGKVFAIDISPEMLNDLEVKINENNIANVEMILAEKNHLKLEAGKVTLAFVSNVLHEINEKDSFLNEVKRILCPNGKIAIVEWEKINGEFGPPIDYRIDRIELVKMIDKLGFMHIATIDIGEDFYGIVAQK